MTTVILTNLFCLKVITTKEDKGTISNMDEGLTPRDMIRTKHFFLLSLKIMITELVFFYILFVYKVWECRHQDLCLAIICCYFCCKQPYGLSYVKDDLLMSTIGACAALSNTLFRLVVGFIKDLISYKVCLIIHYNCK